jgi:hypothetical protein
MFKILPYSLLYKFCLNGVESRCVPSQTDQELQQSIRVNRSTDKSYEQTIYSGIIQKNDTSEYIYLEWVIDCCLTPSKHF